MIAAIRAKRKGRFCDGFLFGYTFTAWHYSLLPPSEASVAVPGPFLRLPYREEGLLAARQAENGQHHGLVKENRIESSFFYLLCDVGFFWAFFPLISYVGILIICSLQGEGEIQMT